MVGKRREDIRHVAVRVSTQCGRQDWCSRVMETQLDATAHVQEQAKGTQSGVLACSSISPIKQRQRQEEGTNTCTSVGNSAIWVPSVESFLARVRVAGLLISDLVCLMYLIGPTTLHTLDTNQHESRCCCIRSALWTCVHSICLVDRHQNCMHAFKRNE